MERTQRRRKGGHGRLRWLRWQSERWRVCTAAEAEPSDGCAMSAMALRSHGVESQVVGRQRQPTMRASAVGSSSSVHQQRVRTSCSTYRLRGLESVRSGRAADDERLKPAAGCPPHRNSALLRPYERDAHTARRICLDSYCMSCSRLTPATSCLTSGTIVDRAVDIAYPILEVMHNSRSLTRYRSEI